MRSRRLRQECKLKLQLCAIMSQTQNHTEALENARKSVKIVHQMFKDMEELCQIYIDKINYKENLQAAQEQSDLEDDEREQIIQMVLDSSPAKEIPKNFLEQSISLAERLSIKLCPVVKEVRKRIVGAPPQINFERKRKSDDMNLDQIMPQTNQGDLSSAAITAIGINTSVIEQEDKRRDLLDVKLEVDDEDDEFEEEKPDMRSVLGFLNQNEWISNLNIGNIMQIQPIAMKDILNEPNDELELTRDVFLEKLSILTVSYFCMSTEMRFLLQSRANFLKPEVKRDRETESEYWHAKALEIACTFLPSDCPLLNHVLLSYQKHHDPSMQPIKEDEESKDLLQVLRPLKGIESSKYQPIIRCLPQVKVNLSPTAQLSVKRLLLINEERSVQELLRFHEGRLKRTDTLVVDQQVQVSPLFVGKDQMTSSLEYGLNNMLPEIHMLKGTTLNDEQLSDSNEIIDAQGIIIDVFDDSQALLENNQALDDQAKLQKQYEFDLLKSRDKLSKQIDQISLIHEHNDQVNNSIEGLLEKQILEGVDSPNKNSHDMINGDPLLAEDNTDSKLYDKIIQKIIDNPKIDKRTLMQRFIAKIEMESNNAGSMAEELNLIKQFVQGLPNPGTKGDHVLNDTLNVSDKFYSEDENNFNGMRSLGEDQINANTSVDFLQVPQESSGVFNVGLNNLVQLSSNLPKSNEIQQQVYSTLGRKQSSAKTQVAKKFTTTAGADKVKPQSQLKPSFMNEFRAASSLRAPNHNISQQTASSGPALLSNEHKTNRPTKNRKRKEQKSRLEQDSLFKDIEKASDYHGINASVASENHRKTQLESAESDSEKIQSGSRLKRRKEIIQARQSSERKLSSQSRPSTAMTQPTRHSSALMNQKKRNILNQSTAISKQSQTCAIKNKQTQSKSNSSSSAKRRAIRGLNKSGNLIKNKENLHPNISKKLSQSRMKEIHRKRPSYQQDSTFKSQVRPVSSMAVIQKPSHNTSQHAKFPNNHGKYQLTKKRQNFSQTKFVCQQKPFAILPRDRRAKQQSNSKSSGKKSNSANKSKSKSMGSEQNTILQNELAQSSFDMIIPEGYNKKSQACQRVRRNYASNASLCELQKQVFANQQMLLEILNKQRNDSAPDLNAKNKNYQKEKTLASVIQNAQSLFALQDQHNSQINDFANTHQTHYNTALQQLNKSKRKSQGAIKNSASQQMQGLSKIIQPQIQSQQKHGQGQHNTEQQRKNMNKTLAYLQQLSNQGSRVSKKDDQNMKTDSAFKQSLINEVAYLKNKMQDQLIKAQQALNQSPKRNNSSSLRRSGDRERKRSNSRSPSQPAKARIPKKKEFESQGQFMGVSTGLGIFKHGPTSSSVNKILNCSLEDITKFAMPSDQREQTNPLKVYNQILPQKILLKAKQLSKPLNNSKIKHHDQDFQEDLPKENRLKRQAEQFLGQMANDSHHSVSMFDSELNLSNNKGVNKNIPLQHQLSQNEIFGKKHTKSKVEQLTPKINRLYGNFAQNPNHSVSLQAPENKNSNQGKRTGSRAVGNKVFDRQSTNRSGLIR